MVIIIGKVSHQIMQHIQSFTISHHHKIGNIFKTISMQKFNNFHGICLKHTKCFDFFYTGVFMYNISNIKIEMTNSEIT